MENIFAGLPDNQAEEVFTELLIKENVRIERIVSLGHVSPALGWYEQEQHEWVLVLEGEAVLQFADGSEVRLKRGNHCDIPAGRRHKVSWTDPDRPTIWLAVHYR